MTFRPTRSDWLQAAALALLSYGNMIRQGGFGQAIGRSAAFVASVPAFDLGRGPIPAMAAAVERVAGLSNPRPDAAE